MRLRTIPLIFLVFMLCARGDAQISPRFRTVYLTPMQNEMDQHLASRLTSTRTLWVVLDPASADAIMTDSLDDNFWNWLSRTYPTPKGASANRAPADRNGAQTAPRHRGTVFLVDPKTRLVLWSTYDLPKNFSPGELDRVAAHINSQLKAALAKK